jgi:hypothetical protein
MRPETPFTPEWNIHLWTTQYTNLENLKIIRDWITTNGPIIIEKYKSKNKNDGGTGLG